MTDTINRDDAAVAYRTGIDAAADGARATIADAEAKLAAAKDAVTPAVQKAETAYQQDRLKRAKAALAKVEKAQKADDDAQKPAEKPKDAAKSKDAPAAAPKAPETAAKP